MPTGSDEGASAVEYGLIVFAVAALIAATVFLLGGTVLGLYDSSCDTMASKITPDAPSCTP